jgi:cytidylate kinase
MKIHTSFEKLKIYFEEKVYVVPGHKPEQVFHNEPFVTISRETGVRGVEIGEKLVEYLNEFDKKRHKDWILFDKNILEQVMQDHLLSEQVKNFIHEKRSSELQGILEQFFGLHPSIQSLVHKMSSTILHIASIGNVVIIGRGSTVITRNLKNGYHIRLISGLESKIQNVMELHNYDRQRAVKYIEEEDKGRNEYIRKNFRKNIEDPSLYTMVLNVEKFSHPDVAELIAHMVIKDR